MHILVSVAGKVNHYKCNKFEYNSVKQELLIDSKKLELKTVENSQLFIYAFNEDTQSKCSVYKEIIRGELLDDIEIKKYTNTGTVLLKMYCTISKNRDYLNFVVSFDENCNSSCDGLIIKLQTIN